MYESSSCTICMNIWCCQDLNLRHLYGWREVSHCGFNLHSLMTNHLLYVFIFVVHIYIYWFFQLLPLLSLCCRPYSYIQNRNFNWYVYFSHVPSKKKNFACSKIMIELPSLFWKFISFNLFFQFSSVQLLSRVWLFATPWTAARQASLSISNCQEFTQTHVHWVSDAI